MLSRNIRIGAVVVVKNTSITEYINNRSLHSVSHNYDKIPCAQKLNRIKIKVKSLLCLILWCDNQKGISVAIITTD